MLSNVGYKLSSISTVFIVKIVLALGPNTV